MPLQEKQFGLTSDNFGPLPKVPQLAAPERVLSGSESDIYPEHKKWIKILSKIVFLSMVFGIFSLGLYFMSSNSTLLKQSICQPIEGPHEPAQNWSQHLTSPDNSYALDISAHLQFMAPTKMSYLRLKIDKIVVLGTHPSFLLILYSQCAKIRLHGLIALYKDGMLKFDPCCHDLFLFDTPQDLNVQLACESTSLTSNNDALPNETDSYSGTFSCKERRSDNPSEKTSGKSSEEVLLVLDKFHFWRMAKQNQSEPSSISTTRKGNPALLRSPQNQAKS